MPARTLSAAAAFAAAVAVYALVCRDRRRLRREAVSQRLMAGCQSRDNDALRRELEAFRRRIDLELAGRAVVQEADQVLSDALAAHNTRIDPTSEGGAAA